MKVWILKRLATVPVYDVTNALVVRAKTEADARAISAKYCGDEKAETWINEAESTCEPLTNHGEPGMIVHDFNAG